MKKILSIFIAAVMVISLIPVTVSAAVDVSSVSGAHATLDSINDSANAVVLSCGGDRSPSLSMSKGKYSELKFWGWMGLSSQNIVSYGYSINGATIVYSTSTIVHSMTEEGVTSFTYAYRFNIAAPVEALGVGTHTITAYAKLADGTDVLVATLTLTVTEALADGETELEVYKDDLSIMDFDFQDSVFTNGYLLTTGGSAGNTFKTSWCVQDGASQNYSVTVVDGSNTYAKFQGFMEVIPDYRWNRGYEMSVDLKGYSSTYGTGVFINTSSSNYKSSIADSAFPLYECYASGADKYLGNTGLFLTFTSATTAVLVIHTYDASNTYANASNVSYSGVVTANLTVPSMDSFQTLKIVDDDNGTITLSMGGATIAVVKYADDGIYADTVFTERYYKTVKVYDASNTLLAETNNALMSYYNWIGFGTRNSTLCIDNIAFADYTAPAKTLSVNLGASATTVEPGATVSILVNLAGDAEILLANGKLTYDSAIAYKNYTYSGSIFSGFDTASSFNTSTAGEVSFIIMNSALEDVVANGMLVKFNFTVPADAADGTQYTFGYVPSDLGDAFVNYNEDDFYPTSVTGVTITVEVPEVETPTEITLVDGSIYSIDTTNNIILVKSTAFSSGVTYAALMSNFTTPEYIQLVNANGTVVTAGGRLSNKFSINLVDADGNVVKTYALAFVGDLNVDGRINSSDTSYLQSNNSGYTSGTVEFHTANVNSDRRVNGSDLSYLLGLAQLGTFA